MEFIHKNDRLKYCQFLKKMFFEICRFECQSVEEIDGFIELQLGYSYQFGIILPQNYEKALNYYYLSAQNGNKYAQNCLAYMYLHGLGTKSNVNSALHYCRLSALQGYEVAQFSLAEYLYNKDTKLALEYYKKSADQGYQKAIDKLEKLSENNKRKIPQIIDEKNEQIKIESKKIKNIIPN